MGRNSKGQFAKKKPNEYELFFDSNNVLCVRLELDKGKTCTLTFDDFKDKGIWKHRYHARSCNSGRLYAVRAQREPDGSQINVYLHREILSDIPKGYVADHVSTDSLDCRSSNLRPATFSQNQWNRSIDRRNTSGVIGVSRHKANGKWQALIAAHGVRYHLGYFNTLEEAKEARRVAAEKYHGEYAYQPRKDNE